ncbi:MAG: Scr1 family TA system antitoxin-like transcriptional regulator [Pseudonocardiaceae bacterium]
MFVDLERNTATLRSVEVEVIPGLLQTDNYIRGLRPRPVCDRDRSLRPLSAPRRPRRPHRMGRTRRP